MVRQDPEPKVITTVHDFPVAAFGTATTLTGGTSITVNAFTNQFNNEQCTFYGYAVDVMALDANGNQLTTATTTSPYFYAYQSAAGTSVTGTFTDFDVNFFVGGNTIPSDDISTQRLLMPKSMHQQRYISFPSPILVLYQQPIQVMVQNNVAIAGHRMTAAGGAADVRTVRVKITLIGQSEIQKRIA